MNALSRYDRPSALGILIRTLLAAVIATSVNLVYSAAYTALTGYSIPEIINAGSVILFSAAPVVLGGVLYLIVTRFSVRVANVGLWIGTILLFVALTIPTFTRQLPQPDGTTLSVPLEFTGLSLGLHFAGPLSLLGLVPRRPRH